MIKLIQIGIGSRRVGDHSPGQRLHCNKANVFLLALAYQGKILFRGKVTEGKLKDFVQSGVNCLLGYRQTMVCNSNVTDFALLFRFQHCFIQAGPIPRFWTDCRIVELVDIDVIRLQQF